ncbi:MAG: RsmB/NOP family class I SAM-dependent RNA methyltransferase [Candidatus Omnitrophica bacterium]|nr:RsmB/NOP family class I SAM-dependent RNA methyltransferase [Candidatus Omnitrophota bacterium]
MKSTVYKLPQEFIDKLKKIYPQSYTKIAATFLNKKQTAFRINHLKTDIRNLRKNLLEQRVRFQELSFPRGAFLLKNPLRDFQRTDVYKQGLVYVQNISSMLPPLVLSPQDSDRILDLCAAPGAKTTLLTSLAPRAQITAVEKIRTRYYKLLANLKTQGADSVKVYLMDSTLVRKKFPERFNKILADVPCSTEGRFLISNPNTFKYWKQKKVKEMVHKQKKLLHSAFFALEEGGELVYSTCTFSPEENEGVIDWFLNKFKANLEILPIELNLSNAVSGLKSFKDNKFSSQMFLTKRIIPNDTMEGFYIARLKKTSV